jgi:O-methyltransferase
MSLATSRPDPPSVSAVRLLQIIEHEFADGLKAARAVHATAPHADAASLRVAYLDLLKLCLCDLAAGATSSVARTQQGHVMSRELTGEQLRLRAAGMDWPLHGLTMVGLRRLDDLQECVESVVADRVAGDLIEAGSWRGGAALLMRATLDTLERSERSVWVADSFQGFPQSDRQRRPGYDLEADLAGFDFLAVPLEEVKQTFERFGFERGINFVPGFFEETLPPLAGRPWSVIRIDGDTYSSVRTALESLYPGLATGGYLIVDDYLSLDQCKQAVDDFRSERGIAEPIEEVDWNCARWRRTSDAPLPTAGERRMPSGTPRALRPAARAGRARIPAIEEVELSEENERLRQRLNELEAELDRLTRSPWRGPRAWMERIIRRRRRDPQ